MGLLVIETMLDILNSGHVPKELNHTFIALIPKLKNLVKVEAFRPIALCNVIYKLVLKAVANRLKVILPNIISTSHSAFVLGRQIINNILVAYELVHYLQRKTKDKKGYMSINLDTSKAYDRVEWSYLQRIMKKLGFRS